MENSALQQCLHSIWLENWFDTENPCRTRVYLLQADKRNVSSITNGITAVSAAIGDDGAAHLCIVLTLECQTGIIRQERF